jgi:hypothetical protein
MDYWTILDQQAEAVAHKTYMEQARGVQEGLQLAESKIFAGAFRLPVSQPPTDALVVQMTLMSENLNVFKAAADLAIRGYYRQSIGMLRTAYENWLATLYLVKHPEKAREWLEPEFSKHPPGAGTMRQALKKVFGDTASQVSDLYAELCHFAHTDPVSVVSMLTAAEGGTVIETGVKYNPDDFLTCVSPSLLRLAICWTCCAWPLMSSRTGRHGTRR